MKNILLLASTFLFSMSISAQEKLIKNSNKIDYSLGKGLTISMQENKYYFKLNGFAVPYAAYNTDSTKESTTNLQVLTARLRMEAGAFNERVIAALDADFIDGRAVLEAFMGVNVINLEKQKLLISFGQKRNFMHNRSMMMNEKDIFMVTRSILSTDFSNTGREMGLFAEGKFTLGSIGLMPAVGVTTGDGRNSFGANSNDNDLGGFKFGGRLDVMPLGYFKDNGHLTGHDFAHEEQPKLAVGGAFSINMGASQAVGEGHGTEDGGFITYDNTGEEKWANYQKIYADILFKWRGWSLLAEFVNATAQSNEIIYMDALAQSFISTQGLSNYYFLGNAFHAKMGYFFQNIKLGLSGGYAMTTQEFDLNTSLLKNQSQASFAVAKFLGRDNGVKIQLVGNWLRTNGSEALSDQYNDAFQAQFVTQFSF